MKLLTTITLGVAIIGGAAHAVPSGEYEFRGEGLGTATVTGSDFSMGFGISGCSGSIDGTIKPAGTNTWKVFAPTSSGETCEVTITHQGDHYSLAPSYGCTSFSGASCGMSGRITPIAGTPMAEAASDMSVLAASFRSQTPDFRKRMQQNLAAKGHYRGPIDGAYGPGTEGAILAAAETENIDLGNNDGIALMLGKLISGQ